jgi:NADH-quinone oxidoreductase subunit J
MKIIFYVFLTVAVLSSVGILINRNVFHAALLLLACLLAIAGIYVIALAEFVAVTQILVYAGGIVVVILFAIMLTSRINGRPFVVSNKKWFAGLLVGVALFLVLLNVLIRDQIFSVDLMNNFSFRSNTLNQLGIQFMTGYLLPFEVAGVLLLITLIGAAVMASFRKNEPLDSE